MHSRFDLFLARAELRGQCFAEECDIGLAQPATSLTVVAVTTCTPRNPISLDLVAIPGTGTRFAAHDARRRAEATVALHYSCGRQPGDILCGIRSRHMC